MSEKIVNISPAGRKALADDTQMSARQRLILEIGARVEDVTPEHLTELVISIAACYDDDETALLAVKAGDVILTKVPR